MGNKMPIAWHEQCLTNYRASLEHKRQLLKELQTEVKQMEQRAAQYQCQIDLAKEQGKTEFDPDRYGKK